MHRPIPSTRWPAPPPPSHRHPLSRQPPPPPLPLPTTVSPPIAHPSSHPAAPSLSHGPARGHPRGHATPATTAAVAAAAACPRHRLRQRPGRHPHHLCRLDIPAAAAATAAATAAVPPWSATAGVGGASLLQVLKLELLRGPVWPVAVAGARGDARPLGAEEGQVASSGRGCRLNVAEAAGGGGRGGVGVRLPPPFLSTRLPHCWCRGGCIEGPPAPPPPVPKRFARTAAVGRVVVWVRGTGRRRPDAPGAPTAAAAFHGCPPRPQRGRTTRCCRGGGRPTRGGPRRAHSSWTPRRNTRDLTGRVGRSGGACGVSVALCPTAGWRATARCHRW